jgi:hypothetical protein
MAFGGRAPPFAKEELDIGAFVLPVALLAHADDHDISDLDRWVPQSVVSGSGG